MKKNIFILIFTSLIFSQKILIPMDFSQTDHLKSYGVAFWSLKQGINVEWLLNYRGGSFLIDSYSMIENECKLRGIVYEKINASTLGSILAEIESNNIALVFNTTETPQAIKDSKSIRRSSLENSIPYYTTVSGAIAAVSGIKAIRNGEMDVDTIQSYKK